MASDRGRPFARARGCAVASLALALVCGAAPVSAEPGPQDRETARALMIRGDKALEAGKPAEALESFEAARAILDVPTTAIGVAKAQAALGRFVEARDTALQVSRSTPEANEPDAFAVARDEAAALAQSLAGRIATVEINVSGGAEPSAIEVSVDGDALPQQPFPVMRRLDPGRHVIRAAAPGFAPVEREVTLEEGGTVELDLPLVAAAGGPSFGSGAPPPSDAPAEGGGLSPLVFVGFGVGAAGAVIGGITGGLSLSRASDAEAFCEGTQCTPDAREDIDAAKTLATVSNVSFAIAAAGVVVGAIGIALSGSDEEAPTVSAVAGPSSLRLEGRF